MTAKICADIKPNGLSQKDLIDIIYMMTYSLKGICAKLDDDDASVTDYEKACVTDVFGCFIQDTKGNSLMLNGADESSSIMPFFNIGPLGIGSKELIDWMYQWTYGFYTMCYKLDNSAGVDGTTFLSDGYNTYLLYTIENSKGNTKGYSTAYTFRPTGVFNQDKLVDFLYDAIKAFDIAAALMDADGTLTDTDYESLWYTATITLTVEKSTGDRIGN